MEFKVGQYYKMNSGQVGLIKKITEHGIQVEILEENGYEYSTDLRGNFVGDPKNIWSLNDECDEEGNELKEIVATIEPEKPLKEEIKDLTFGQAIVLLKSGAKVSREGWNGKGMYLELQVPDEHSKMSLPYIYMKTACDNLVPWLASQTDILAEDWVIYNG